MIEPVYDLMNCGPRNRFVVRGSKDHEPMIVHNCENWTQAIARDIMYHGMLQCELKGYPQILSVYDEAVAEVPKNKGSIEEMEKLLCDLPKWAKGLPIAAEGFVDKRYHK